MIGRQHTVKFRSAAMLVFITPTRDL